MKLIHITDIHLSLEATLVEGQNPGRNFAECVDHVATYHGDADLCVITGDLTHWGEVDAYRHVKDKLDGFPIPLRLLLGNHDDRDSFRQVFPDVPTDPNGFVQSSEATSAGRFIYLDTTEPETHAGHFGPERQQWLKAELDTCRDVPCYLFMHHPPMPIGIRAMDDIGQKDAGGLRRILEAHAPQISHIFFGHCHLPLSGTICGIPFAALRGTNHHGWPDFSGSRKLKSADLTPAYNVVLIEDRDCVIHTIDFTYSGAMVEHGTTFEDWARTG